MSLRSDELYELALSQTGPTWGRILFKYLDQKWLNPLNKSQLNTVPILRLIEAHPQVLLSLVHLLLGHISCLINLCCLQFYSQIVMISQSLPFLSFSLMELIFINPVFLGHC